MIKNSLMNTTLGKVLINKNVWAFSLLAIFVCFYKPPIVEAIGKLCGSTFNAAVNFQLFQSNLTTPRAGEQVLPSAVQEMLGFLREYRLDSYEISTKMKNKDNILFRQRIVESAWPIRIDSARPYKLILINEMADYSRCKLIKQEKEAALVFCR